MFQFHSREAATWSLQQECGGQPLTVEQNACREEIGSLTSPILRHRLAQELADACLESLFGNLAHWTPIDLERDILNVSKLIDVFNEMLEKVVAQKHRIERDALRWLIEPRSAHHQRTKNQLLLPYLIENGDEGNE